MREIKVTLPKIWTSPVAQLALSAGAPSVSIQDLFLLGPNEPRQEICIRTSTPVARSFVDALLAAPFFDRRKITFSSHELKSLVLDAETREITQPLIIPLTDIFEDLWQNSHISWTFVAKVFGGALLLAFAMFQNNPVLMVGALLFTPFTPLLMGIAFGLCAQDLHLMKQATVAFMVGTLLTCIAAYSVARIYVHPFLFTDFGSLLSNVLISAIAGVIAGMTDADDVGRRQFIGLAATFPYVKFPVWLGVCWARGFPDLHTTGMRLAAFGGNILTIIGVTWCVYLVMGIRSHKFHHFVPIQRDGRAK